MSVEQSGSPYQGHPAAVQDLLDAMARARAESASVPSREVRREDRPNTGPPPAQGDPRTTLTIVKANVAGESAQEFGAAADGEIVDEDALVTKLGNPTRGLKVTSDAQLAANRENSQKSTGPRSVTGKARSAANSLKHGGYAMKSRRADDGRFAEDAEQIAMNMDAIVEAFDPQNGYEASLVLQLARVMRALDVLETFEAELLASSLKDSHVTYTAVSNPLIGVRADQVATAIDQPDAEPEVPWKTLVMFVCEQRWPNQPHPTIPGLWTKEREPGEPADWQNVFRQLIRQSFTTTDEAIKWFDWLHDKHFAGFSRLMAKEWASEVARVHEQFESIQRSKTRLVSTANSLAKQIRMARTPIKDR